MYELPQELASSVRHWRASIYGADSLDLHKQPSDLEKGQVEYGEKDFDHALSPTESSIVLVWHNFALTLAPH